MCEKAGRGELKGEIEKEYVSEILYQRECACECMHGREKERERELGGVCLQRFDESPNSGMGGVNRGGRKTMDGWLEERRDGGRWRFVLSMPILLCLPGH